MATIKELRKMHFYSQEELARRAGISRYTVTRLEGGKIKPGKYSVKVLARTLKVRASDIEFPVFNPVEKAVSRWTTGELEELRPPEEEANALIDNLAEDIQYIRDTCCLSFAGLAVKLNLSLNTARSLAARGRLIHSNRLAVLTVIAWADKLRKAGGSDQNADQAFLEARQEAEKIISGFAVDLRYIVEESGILQFEVADYFGVTTSIISKWKSREKFPRYHVHFLTIHLWADKLRKRGSV